MKRLSIGIVLPPVIAFLVAEIAVNALLLRPFGLPRILISSLIDAGVVLVVLYPVLFRFYHRHAARDNAERKRLIDDLKRSEARFRSVFEQAPFSIQLFSPDGTTTDVNSAWKNLWNVDQNIVDNLVLGKYNILDDPTLAAKGIALLIAKAFKGEAAETTPILYDPADIGKPGRPRWVAGYVYPIKDDRDNIREVVLMHNDVTDRENALRELEKAIRLRDEFLLIASHELRTPLTSLGLQIQLLNRMAEQGTLASLTKSRAGALLKISQQQLERVSTFINDLLDVSRIGAGRLTLTIDKVDLPEVIQGVVDQFKAELSKVKCPVTVRADPIMGNWDRMRVEKIIVNLLSNAMKFGAGKPIEITARMEGENARIAVQDHGVGVAKQDQTRIFERFERAVSARTYGGLGMGLYIVRQIVEAHGGSIRIESEPGSGATFIVELPVKPMVTAKKP